MTGDDDRERFERIMLPHLDSAYRLARWLLRTPEDAEDAVQESYARALAAFATFAGENSSAWLLTVVRNTCYSLLKRRDRLGNVIPFDEAVLNADWLRGSARLQPAPDGGVTARQDAALVRAALAELPIAFREVLVLREIEDLSYAEIARVVDAPIGTVMSRLARARLRLRARLEGRMDEEASGEV